MNKIGELLYKNPETRKILLETARRREKNAGEKNRNFPESADKLLGRRELQLNGERYNSETESRAVSTARR